MAVVSPDTQPTEPRGSIGMIKPSGSHTVRYDDLVDGRYLYNRCHLIGYQLTGEGPTSSTLLHHRHALLTPGHAALRELDRYCVAAGDSCCCALSPCLRTMSLLRAACTWRPSRFDDDGASVSFNVFCYNVQPGVGIDYATGDSWREQDAGATTEPAGTAAQSNDEQARTYVLNTNTRKFHLPGADSVSRMKARNKQITMTRSEVMTRGYEPCAQCNP